MTVMTFLSDMAFPSCLASVREGRRIHPGHDDGSVGQSLNRTGEGQGLRPRLAIDVARVVAINRVKDPIPVRYHARSRIRNPEALREAQAADARRAQGKALGPLDGIPLLQPQALMQETRPTEALTASRWRFPPKMILVVDDGNENRELVRLVLEETGLSVIEAENGRYAPDRKGLPLDIDVLLYGDLLGNFDGLILPRAEILKNAFVLWPLALLMPDALHPGVQRRFKELWQAAQIDQTLWPVAFSWRDQQLTPAELIQAYPAS